MTRDQSRIAKLLEITVERGASPAEAETARRMVHRVREEQDRRNVKTLHDRQNVLTEGIARTIKSAPVADVGHRWGGQIALPPPGKWVQQCTKCGDVRVTGLGPDGWTHTFFNSDGVEIPAAIMCEGDVK